MDSQKSQSKAIRPVKMDDELHELARKKAKARGGLSFSSYVRLLIIEDATLAK